MLNDTPNYDACSDARRCVACGYGDDRHCGCRCARCGDLASTCDCAARCDHCDEHCEDVGPLSLVWTRDGYDSAMLCPGCIEAQREREDEEEAEERAIDPRGEADDHGLGLDVAEVSW